MMLRSPAIAIFIVAIFVERVCPAPHEIGSKSTAEEGTTNEKSTSDIVTNNATEATRAPVKRPDNEKVGDLLQISKNNSAETVEPLSPANKTSVKKEQLKEKTDCKYEKEQDNMLHCFVTPHDDDNDGDQPSSLNATEIPVTSPIPPRKESPADNKSTNVTKEPSQSDWLNKAVYDTVAPGKDDPKNASIAEATHIDTKLRNNEVNVSVSSVAPLLIDNVRNIGSEGIIETAKSTDKNDSKSMPSGIIALVTAVTFAILIVIGYISLVAWRRYLEYRYGHRELLVNDLEFDTNDLRHFEL